MSLLMYSVWEDQAEIMTDTLVTQADGVTPAAYDLKAWPLPQSNMVMAVTGTANIGAEWFRLIESSNADVEALNEIAPEALRAIQATLGPTGISTVYHFGFPTGSADMVAYEYTSRAGNNYEPWRIPPGSFAVKPGPGRFKTELPESPEEKITLARRLREEHDQRLAEGESSAVRIGGDLVAMLVKNHDIQMAQVYRFPDHEELLRQMRPPAPIPTMAQARASFPPILPESAPA